MEDEGDLKSLGRNPVWVRIPPPPPTIIPYTKRAVAGTSRIKATNGTNIKKAKILMATPFLYNYVSAINLNVQL